MQDWIESLESLNDSDIMALLQQLPPEDQKATLLEMATARGGGPKLLDHRERDVLRKREKRMLGSAIVIPEVKNPKRRERCLADPFEMMRTYYSDRFTRPFSMLHHKLVDTVIESARKGTDQAWAAPRGIGKTELLKAVLVYLILAQIVRFPIAIGATASLAYNIFDDVKGQFETNELLYEDFPEICHPVRELEGAPQRARRQNIDGVRTRIIWKSSKLIQLPYVPGSPYGGVKLAYYGLDGAFRGVNIAGGRPDLALVDDPETRDSARNPEQVAIREQTMDRDIGGLGGHGAKFCRVVITTIQNRFCYSWRVTDPAIKPAFDGKRFGLIETWPTELEMWQEYVTRRQNAQRHGDKLAKDATRYFLENYDRMIAGAKLNDDGYDPQIVDGEPQVHHPLQAAYNWIATNDMAAFMAEKQNEPEAEEVVETEALSAALVRSRLAVQTQGVIPDGTERIVAAMDMGKRLSHWVVIAFKNPGIGTVIDYGCKATFATNEADLESKSALELMLKNLILDWIEDDLKPYKIDGALVDSGAFTDAVYAACRQARQKQFPLFAAKGWDNKRFKMPQAKKGVVLFDQCYAHYDASQELWLYNVNTEYWKMWTHSRFAVAPYTDDGDRTAGSLALYHPGQDIKRHSAYSHHIIAEELTRVPVGSGYLNQMILKSKNNHWLDATALGCAVGGVFKIRVLSRDELTAAAKPVSRPAPVRQAVGGMTRPNFSAGNFIRR